MKIFNIIKSKQKIVIPVILLIAIVFIFPIPIRHDMTLQGSKITKDGDVLEDISITIKLWQLNYLFKDDQINGTVEIVSNEGKVKLQVYNSKILVFDENVLGQGVMYYDQDINAFNSGYIFFDKNFGTYMIDLHKDELFYIATKNGQMDIEDIRTLFDRFIK